MAQCNILPHKDPLARVQIAKVPFLTYSTATFWRCSSTQVASLITFHLKRSPQLPRVRLQIRSQRRKRDHRGTGFWRAGASLRRTRHRTIECNGSLESARFVLPCIKFTAKSVEI